MCPFPLCLIEGSPFHPRRILNIQNSYLMQYQSDILSSEVLLPNCLETTALGAAYLAGLQTGFWKDLEDIKSVHKYQRLYKPNMKKSEIKIIDKRWKTAIKATRMIK